MRTQRGYRALDVEQTPVTPEAGMHNSYDVNGNARYCPCSEFWEGNPDPDHYVAHEDVSPKARVTFAQIAYMKLAKQ